MTQKLVMVDDYNVLLAELDRAKKENTRLREEILTLKNVKILRMQNESLRKNNDELKKIEIAAESALRELLNAIHGERAIISHSNY